MSTLQDAIQTERARRALREAAVAHIAALATVDDQASAILEFLATLPSDARLALAARMSLL